jgi:hypothetical protein
MIRIDTYKEAEDALRINDMRQCNYDAGALLMSDVLVNLHGDEHRSRRNLESKIFRRDFFHHYEREVFPATLAKTMTPFLDKGSLDTVDFGHRVTTLHHHTGDGDVGFPAPKTLIEEISQLGYSRPHVATGGPEHVGTERRKKTFNIVTSKSLEVPGNNRTSPRLTL